MKKVRVPPSSGRVAHTPPIDETDGAPPGGTHHGFREPSSFREDGGKRVLWSPGIEGPSSFGLDPPGRRQVVCGHVSSGPSRRSAERSVGGDRSARPNLRERSSRSRQRHGKPWPAATCRALPVTARSRRSGVCSLTRRVARHSVSDAGSEDRVAGSCESTERSCGTGPRSGWGTTPSERAPTTGSAIERSRRPTNTRGGCSPKRECSRPWAAVDRFTSTVERSGLGRVLGARHRETDRAPGSSATGAPEARTRGRSRKENVRGRTARHRAEAGERREAPRPPAAFEARR